LFFHKSGLNMSEMLANQYFMVRRFLDAETAFENLLAQDPLNRSARKKMIICLVHNGKIKKALELFYSLIKEDISIITSTNLIDDDCPCPEIITKFENINEPELLYQSKLEILGMLWLYCDYYKSIQHFEKLKEFNPNEPIYSDILKVYKDFVVSKIS
ncbi:MAG: tetratricopeptide repeat protein, partial [Ignavibacteria bacterium]|nr:tetratricopeptide repeat protein [Ignavibacteria bacterium]